MRMLVALTLLASVLSAQTITIAPAPVDRAALIAEFTLAEDAPGPNRARKADGTSLPVQVDDDGKACIAIGFLRAGESLTLSLQLRAVAADGETAHKAGKHDESMKALGEAKKILGI